MVTEKKKGKLEVTPSFKRVKLSGLWCSNCKATFVFFLCASRNCL
ncbi:unnamed protein product [Discosporangium mesarthrocarpum]